jgi:hypothetical protein
MDRMVVKLLVALGPLVVADGYHRICAVCRYD